MFKNPAQKPIKAYLRYRLTDALHLVEVEPSIESLLGFSTQSWLTSQVSLVELIHTDDHHLLSTLLSCQPTSLTGSFNLRIRQANGNICYCVFDINKTPSSLGCTIEVSLQQAYPSGVLVNQTHLKLYLDALLAFTDDFISVKDHHHLFTSASQSMMKLCTSTNRCADLFGKTDYDLFAESYADRNYQLEQLIFNGSPFIQEIQKLVTPTGDLTWIDNRKFPIKDSNHNVIGVLSIARDITKQQLAERNMAEQMKRVEQYERIAKIGHWELEVASNCLFWSDEIFHIFETDKSAFNANYEAFLDAIHPDDRNRVNDAYIKSLSDKQPYAITHRLLMKDGRVKHVQEQCVTEFDQDGKPLISRGTVQDISDLARAQEKITASEKLLRDIIETLPMRVFWKDTKGFYLGCNTAFAQDAGKQSPEELIGKDDFQMTWRSEAELYRADDRFVMDSLTPKLGFEEPQTTPNGGEIWLRTSKLPLLNDAAEVIGVLGIYNDISDQKRAERSLRLSASVFTHAREGIIITDKDANIIEVNKSFCDITGYGREEVLNKNPRFLHSGRQDELFYKEMWESLNTQGYWSGEIWNRRKNGSVFPELETITVVYDEQGNIQNYIALYSDISTLKEHQSKLEHLAHYDALTGLANRILLSNLMKQAINQVDQRNEKVAIAFIDLDGFKTVNDHHGHKVGDKFLIALTERMKNALRKGDILARIGGDEFVALLVDLPNNQSSYPILDNLLKATAESVCIDDIQLHLSASIGVSFYPQFEEMDSDQLVRQADQAMYLAKQSGKNRYYLFDAEQDRNAREYHDNLKQIRNALKNNEFILFYQPKVNMLTGDILGVEALIRWQHPKLGLISPANFLPIIEKHDLSIELGEWVLDRALEQIEIWHSQDLCIPISVNVGALQLQHPNFVTTLRSLLANHPSVNPGELELEILETSALEDFGAITNVIAQCKHIGINFALDDFGTGYSSLTYLKQLPTDVLKIDQSFVRDMLEDSDDLAILKGIIELAKAFNRNVIAEGVETLEQSEMLLQLGCSWAQGYLIARPMPAIEFVNWMTTWKQPESWTHHSPNLKSKNFAITT